MSGGLPSSTARQFRTASVDMATRVSSEALAMWGARTTLVSGRRPGWIVGSSSKTSSPAAAIQPSRERPDERRLVHDGTAGGVDSDGRLLHAAQRALVDQVTRLGREQRVQAHEVGLAQQRVRVGGRRVQLALDAGVGPDGVVIEHAHPESRRPARHRAADAAEADDAERLAVDVDCPTEDPTSTPSTGRTGRTDRPRRRAGRRPSAGPRRSRRSSRSGRRACWSRRPRGGARRPRRCCCSRRRRSRRP